VSQDRSKPPPGYEVWDFYDIPGDPERPPGGSWRWSALGDANTDDNTDYTREQVVAACWAHYDAHPGYRQACEERDAAVEALREAASFVGFVVQSAMEGGYKDRARAWLDRTAALRGEGSDGG
jgi:hypothetical protein